MQVTSQSKLPDLVRYPIVVGTITVAQLWVTVIYTGLIFTLIVELKCPVYIDNHPLLATYNRMSPNLTLLNSTAFRITVGLYQGEFLGLIPPHARPTVDAPFWLARKRVLLRISAR